MTRKRATATIINEGKEQRMWTLIITIALTATNTSKGGSAVQVSVFEVRGFSSESLCETAAEKYIKRTIRGDIYSSLDRSAVCVQVTK